MLLMLRKTLLKLIGVSVVVLIFWFLHQGGGPDASHGKSIKPGPTATHSATSQSAKKGDIVRAMAIQISYTADGVDTYLRMIDEIAALGANTVGLSTAGHQDHAGSTTISLDVRKCPTKKQWATLIKRAHSHKMRVAIMPVVLLSSPRGKEWRGVIQPPNWDEWFASYLAFIKYFARVGLDNNAEILVVGAELISTESFRPRWLKVIKEVRGTYHGKLVYSANWDHYAKVSFWDQLDLIGMTTYHKLADKENPPLDTLLKSWSKIKTDILSWQKKIGKPILFTEVGWCSQPGTSIEAWNYYRHERPSPEGLEEQKKCYQAFIKTWQDEPAVAGAIWWEWIPGKVGPKDYGYSPKGKPAEAVLRKWFKNGGTRKW